MKIFNQINYDDFESYLLNKIDEKINSEKDENILDTKNEEYVNRLVNDFSLQPIRFKIDQISMGGPEIGYVANRGIYNYTLTIPFEGSPELLEVQPTNYIHLDLEAELDLKASIIKTEIFTLNPDPIEYENKKKKVMRDLEANCRYIKKSVDHFNKYIVKHIKNIFRSRRKLLLKESETPDSAGIKINLQSDNYFYFKSIKVKPVFRPGKDVDNKKPIEIPVLHNFIYFDLKNVILNFCQALEKKPLTFQGKSEAELRDLILAILEFRYNSTSETGEAFSINSSNDVLLKNDDNTNIFVLECRYWEGKKKYFQSIVQILKSLKWHESKAVLLLFVKSKDFKNVLKTIEKETPSHAFFAGNGDQTKEASFPYFFKLSEEVEPKIFLEVMVFHFEQTS